MDRTARNTGCFHTNKKSLRVRGIDPALDQRQPRSLWNSTFGIRRPRSKLTGYSLNNDKLRLVVTLATSADHAFLKGDSARAKKEDLDAMKMAEGMPNVELTETKFDLCLNLYLAYNTDQEYGKAYEYLSNGLKLMGARLGPDDLTRYQDLLRECENNRKANRKRK